MWNKIGLFFISYYYEKLHVLNQYIFFSKAYKISFFG
jgi:hypothetical protein